MDGEHIASEAPLVAPDPSTPTVNNGVSTSSVQEKDQTQRPIIDVSTQTQWPMIDVSTQTQDQATSVDQLSALKGDGAGDTPGACTKEADCTKLQPKEEALVSGIRTIRDQLNKLLKSYSQVNESLPSRQDPDKGGNVTVASDTEEEAVEQSRPMQKKRSCQKFPCLSNSFHFCLPIILAILVCCVAWYSERERLGIFDLEGFFLRDPEAASQWERLDRRAIRILVTGKTGTGKSALINGLIGRNVTKEGDTLDPTTSRVEQIKQMVHGISMSVFDSPGLQDGTSREQEYLQDMQQKCEKVDLVLYAIKMTDQRVHAADTKAMKKITDAFGHQFWEKAIFVMTFANEVRSPEYPDDDYENKIYFEKRLQDWIEKLPSIIEQRSGIPIKIGKHVPIIPAGYYKIKDLPGRKFWFSQFWKAALDRMMESSAEGAGYMLQFSQDRLKSYNDTTEEDFQKPIHEQPILSKIIDE